MHVGPVLMHTTKPKPFSVTALASPTISVLVHLGLFLVQVGPSVVHVRDTLVRVRPTRL